MKILSSGLKIFFWIILIISFDIKSDISVEDLDLKEGNDIVEDEIGKK